MSENDMKNKKFYLILRKDILFSIFNHLSPQIINDIYQFEYESNLKKMERLENLIINNDNSDNEEIFDLIRMTNFNKIKNIKLPKTKSDIAHLLIKFGKIETFLKKCQDFFIESECERFIFDKDEEGKTPLDYYVYDENSFNIIYNFKSIYPISGLFLKMIEFIIKNNYNSFYSKRNEIISFILNKIDVPKSLEFCPEEFLTKRYKSKNMFSIISELPFDDEKIEDLFFQKVTITLKEYQDIIEYKNKEKNNFTFEKNPKNYDILNSIDNQNQTIIMKLIKNKHFSLALKIINKYNDILSINQKSDDGNNILHYLFYMIDEQDIKNDNELNRQFFDAINNILKKNKFLLLSKNNFGIPSWLVAFKSGLNNAIFLMTQYIPLEVLMSSYNAITPMHIAAYYNKTSTIRFLVENYKVNLNVKTNIKKDDKIDYYKLLSGSKYIQDKLIINFNLDNESTPLIYAAKNSSVESFKYLLGLGANPFIKNIFNEDAIDIALSCGNKNMIDHVTNIPSYRYNDANGGYLFSLVSNSNCYFKVAEYFNKNGGDNINILSREKNNLLLNAILYGNYKIIPYLLKLGIDINVENIFKNNIFHYCSYKNDICSFNILIDYLKDKNEISKLEILFNSQNNEGKTPLYIAAEKGYIESIKLIFINCRKNKINYGNIKAYNGYWPLHIAIINNHLDAAKLIKYLFGNNEYNIENNLDEHMINKINNFNNKYAINLLKDDEEEQEIEINNTGVKKSKLEKIVDDILEQINKKEIKNEEQFFIEYEKLNKKLINIKINSFMDLRDYNKLHSEFNKYYTIQISEIQYLKIKKYLPISVISKLYELVISEKGSYIKKYLDILLKIAENDDTEICQIKLITLINALIIPDINISEIDNLLKLIELLTDDKMSQISYNHPFISWIESIIISFIENNTIEQFNKLLTIISTFKNIILGNKTLFNNLPYPVYSIKCYEFVHNLNYILTKLSPEFQVIQIKNINQIPPLLFNEIDGLLNSNCIISDFIYSNNFLDIIIKPFITNKGTEARLLDIILNIHKIIKENYQLGYYSQKELLNVCIDFINNKNIDENILLNNILSFVLLSIDLIYTFNLHLYQILIMPKIKGVLETNNFSTIIQILKYLSKIKDYYNIFNCLQKLECKYLKIFFDYCDQITQKKGIKDVNELIQSFQNLNNNELITLHEFYEEFNNNKTEYLINDFKSEGIKLGTLFKNNPNAKNLSKLIKIINSGFEQVFKYSPYIVQNLASATFLFHFFLNIDDYKGRIGQILTGEGKSIIIAILALALALMGNFVDIITTNKYLAKRDQLRFKPLFDAFGVSSNFIVDDNPKKEDFNGIILYGTNTDFEFTLLREGTFLEEKRYTIPLNQTSEVKRGYDTVIVDESDNFFLTKL